MLVFQAVLRMVMNNELHFLIASIITYLVSGFFYAVGYKINDIHKITPVLRLQVEQQHGTEGFL